MSESKRSELKIKVGFSKSQSRNSAKSRKNLIPVLMFHGILHLFQNKTIYGLKDVKKYITLIIRRYKFGLSLTTIINYLIINLKPSWFKVGKGTNEVISEKT